MSQLDGLKTIREQIQKGFQLVLILCRVLETGGKLKQQAPKLFRLDERSNAFLENRDVLRQPIALFVRELLPHFDSELEFRWSTFHPILGGLGITWPVER